MRFGRTILVAATEAKESVSKPKFVLPSQQVNTPAFLWPKGWWKTGAFGLILCFQLMRIQFCDIFTHFYTVEKGEQMLFLLTLKV